MKKGLSRLFALICASTCVFGVVGCGGDDGGADPVDVSDIVKGEKITVDLYNNPYRITVATDGSGDYETLTEALARVKALQNDTSITSGYDAILITLSAGEHAVGAGIEIDENVASGKIPLVIEGSTTGETVLNGGVQIRGGWTEYKDGIYKKTVNGVEDFRQLYIDGEVGTRSRYPNDTGNLTSDYLPLVWNENKSTHDTKGCVGVPNYVYGDLFEGDIQDAELHFVQEWTQSVGHIWNKDWVEEDEFYYFGFEEEWFTRQLFTRTAPIRTSYSNKCWFEDSLKFLDVENEWYFDEDTSTLYYKPQDGADINDMTFEIPQAENIIRIAGTPDKVAKDVSLSKLTIKNTNWNYPSTTGYIDGQAGLFYTPDSSTFSAKALSAGVYTLYAHNVTVDNCHIKQTGAYGVDFHVGTKHARLLNSIVENTASSGVNAGRYYEMNLPEGYISADAHEPETTIEVTEDILVHNNLVQHVGTSFKGGSTGVVAGFIKGLTIEQNTITDVTYSGIAVGWGWETPNTTLCNIKINRNHITNVMNHLPFDGGPIYLVGPHVVTYEGSEIQGNYIEVDDGALGGIYFDNSSSAYVAKNNVIKGAGIHGIIDLHDWNYLLSDITVTNTYSDLEHPIKGVYRHHYLSTTGLPDETHPLFDPASRNVKFDEHIYAYKNGKWSTRAQTIINNAGQIK